MNFTITQWLQNESNGRIVFFYTFEIEGGKKRNSKKKNFIHTIGDRTRNVAAAAQYTKLVLFTKLYKDAQSRKHKIL
jgi:hypothetical protein